MIRDLIEKGFVSVDLSDTLSELIGRMNRARVHHAVVFSNSVYKGVIGKRFLLGVRVDPSKTKVSSVLKHRSKSKTPFFVPTLSESTSDVEAARLFASSGSWLLPVLKKSVVVGVVYAWSLAESLSGNYEGVRVSDIASNEVVTCRSSDSVDKVLKIMARQGIDNVPVVDKDIEGIVTLGDLIDAFVVRNVQRRVSVSRVSGSRRRGLDVGDKSSVSDLPVSSFMTRSASMCCVSPDARVPAVVSLMNKRKVSSVVLVDSGCVVGLFSLRDFFIDFAKR